ncbi:MAG: hypothetical protein ACRD1K_15100 [Acidimicrobiales bacterium]
MARPVTIAAYPVALNGGGDEPSGRRVGRRRARPGAQGGRQLRAGPVGQVDRRLMPLADAADRLWERRPFLGGLAPDWPPVAAVVASLALLGTDGLEPWARVGPTRPGFRPGRWPCQCK